MMPTILDLKSRTPSDKILLIYQAQQDTWMKLQNHIEDENKALTDLTTDVRAHNRLLVTGNGAPSVMEQLRTHQKFIDNVGKLVWVFISAVIVQIVSFIGVAIWTVAQLNHLIK